MGSTPVERGTLGPSAIRVAQCCSAVYLNGKSLDMQSFNELLQALGMAALCVYSGNMASFALKETDKNRATHVKDPL